MKKNNSKYIDFLFDFTDFIWEADRDGILSCIEGETQKVLGYEPQEMKGRNLFDFMSQEEAKILSGFFTKILNKETPIENLEHWTIHRTGSAICLLVNAKITYDENDTFIGYHGMCKDISEKKYLQKELSLQVSECTKQSQLAKAELEDLVSAFDRNVIFSKTDLNGIITHASEAFCDISGYKPSELVGKSHNIIRHPDMPSEVFTELWDSLHKTLHWSGEVKNRRKDGSYYWVFSKIEPDYNPEGEHIGYHAVRQNITAQKELQELSKELENWNGYLETEMTERIRDIILLNKDIKETQKEVVFTMGTIAESRSKETGNHVRRVAEYTKLLALHYGLPEEEAEMLKLASPMHDIGKVAIPDAILNKPAAFDEDERKIMDMHPQLGYDMLKHSERVLLKMAATVAYEHHEKWDGSGYPNALAGENIHIYGRITALADVFDALASDRVYKKAWKLESILQLFQEQRGKHFDPRLVDIFFEKIDEFLVIRDAFVD